MLFTIVMVGCGSSTQKGSSLSYFFDKPASIWEETFPLGNGRIGMMPDGGVEREHYVLNEISMWSGSEQDTDKPVAQESLAEIKRLIFAGQNDEAQALVSQGLCSKGEVSGPGHGQ